MRVFFFLWEPVFADRGQSAKFAEIRTRKIFMLHGTRYTVLLKMRLNEIIVFSTKRS